MKVIIPTIGTRGDVQPYIALSLGLQESGYEVTLASHPVMEALVKSYGIIFKPIGPDVNIGKAAAAIRGRSRNWMLGLIRVMRFTVSTIEQASPDILALCREADLVVVTHSFAGGAEADKLSKPTVSVTLQHQAIPTPDPSQSIFKRTVRNVAANGMGIMMVRPYNKLRRRIGAPTVKGIEEMMSSRLNMIPVRPLVMPRDTRWAPQHCLTGYWFLDEPKEPALSLSKGWTPPVDLRAFLDAGEPPVAISLGAMSLGGGSDALDTVQLVLDAIHEAGVRAIVQGWDETIQVLDLPDTIYHAGAIPHSWLFDHVSCVIHHGGFGTMAATLRAGVPTVVVPHIIDQSFWGQRVHELGVGPQAIPRAELSMDKLAQALTQATQDSEIRARAAQLGKQIRAEAGVQNAVRLIEDAVRT
ncbi:MAG: glycosyltransferase [Anaerolineae bacterium]|nr:glycosyltransferase [Anaerolineae bacterium]